MEKVAGSGGDGAGRKLTSPRNRKGRHLFVFMSTSAKSAAAKLVAKMPHRHETREKIAFRPIPFLHFPAFARNMT
jgi:hypothetical protein